MTANELANSLMANYEMDGASIHVKQAATMLRQQQAEIESLKQSIWAYEQSNNYLDKAQNSEQEDCYGDGNVYRGIRSKDSKTKTIFTTPVDIKYDITIKWDDKTTHHSNVSGNTPLHYNEPKTLTDEEIWKSYKNHPLTSDLRTDIVAFARAILRKAQEK